MSASVELQGSPKYLLKKIFGKVCEKYILNDEEKIYSFSSVPL